MDIRKLNSTSRTAGVLKETFCSRIYDGDIQFASLEQTQIVSFNSWNTVGPKVIFWNKEFKSTKDQRFQARCLVHRDKVTCRSCSYTCLMRLFPTELCDLVIWRRLLICIDHMLWNMRITENKNLGRMWKLPTIVYLTVLRYLPEVTPVKSRKALFVTTDLWTKVRTLGLRNTSQKYEDLKCCV